MSSRFLCTENASVHSRTFGRNDEERGTDRLISQTSKDFAAQNDDAGDEEEEPKDKE